MYGQGNQGSQFRPQPTLQPAPPHVGTHPPVQPGLLNPPLYQNLPMMPPLGLFSLPFQSPQQSHQLPPNFGYNQTGSIPAQIIVPPSAYPPPRLLTPPGGLLQAPFLFRNPQIPPAGVYHANAQVPQPLPNFASASPQFGPAVQNLINEAPLPLVPPESPPPPPPPPSSPPCSPSSLPESRSEESLPIEHQEMPKEEPTKVQDAGSDGLLDDSVALIDKQLCDRVEEVDTDCSPEKRPVHMESNDDAPVSPFQESEQPQISDPDDFVSLTPSESDMDMDDDASQPQSGQEVSDQEKESPKDVMRRPDSGEQSFALSKLDNEIAQTPMSGSPFPVLERHDDGRSPVRDVAATPSEGLQKRLTSPTEGVGPVNSERSGVDTSRIHVKSSGPLGLVKDYASDDSLAGEIKEQNTRSVQIDEREEGEASHYSDTDEEYKHHHAGKHGKASPRKHMARDSQLKVDEFGRMIKAEASSSGSEEEYRERRYVKRDRSWSRSQSPPERRRRTLSPWRQRERRSRSPSWSPRGHSRLLDHQRQGPPSRGLPPPPPPCFQFLRGRCFRGASCRYSHHDQGRLKSRRQDLRHISEDSRHIRGDWNPRMERFPPEGRLRSEISKSFKGKDLNRESSLDSMKDGEGRDTTSNVETNRSNESSQKSSDQLPKSNTTESLEKNPDSDLKEEDSQAPETRNMQYEEGQTNHRSSVGTPIVLPLEDASVPPTASQPPTISSSLETLSSQKPTVAAQPIVSEAPADPAHPSTNQPLIIKASPAEPTYSSTTLGSTPSSHLIQQNQVTHLPAVPLPGFPSGGSHVNQPQVSMPPYHGNLQPYFPPVGHGPQFSYFQGSRPALGNSWQVPRTDFLPQPAPPATGHLSSGPVDYRPAAVPPNLPIAESPWAPVSLAHHQQTRPHGDLIFDHRQLPRPVLDQFPISEFSQRSAPFVGNFLNAEQSKSIQVQPFGSGREDLSAPSMGLPHYQHQAPELRPRLPELPLPAHYSTLPFPSPNYDTPVAQSLSLPITASSSLPISQGPPASDQYDPLFDSIEQKTAEKAIVARVDELGEAVVAEAEVGAVENVSPASPGKEKKSKDSEKAMKLLRIALANFVKEILKPSWRQGTMSKEAFKTVVKKTVDKVSASVSGRHLPRTQDQIDRYVESSRRKLTKLVMGYVDKYVKI